MLQFIFIIIIIIDDVVVSFLYTAALTISIVRFPFSRRIKCY